MSNRRVKQFGLWPSPITPAIVAGGVRLTDVQWTPGGSVLVWREERSGVGVLVAQADRDAPRELTGVLSVRAKVGYGGGDFGLSATDAFFVEQASGRVFRVPLDGGDARPITPAFGSAASPTVSPDGRWVLYVHSYERVDRLAIVDAEGAMWPRIVAEGHDFFMQPCWSPDGRTIAWVAWDHPNMPWDGTRIWASELSFADGELPRCSGEPVALAGGDDVSVTQPAFLDGGRVVAYLSDESGRGRLVARLVGSSDTRAYELPDAEADASAAAWLQGKRTWAVLDGGRRAVVVASVDAFARVYEIDLESGRAGVFDGFEQYGSVDQVSACGSSVAALASSATIPLRVVRLDGDSPGTPAIVRRSTGETVPERGLARAESISWLSLDGSKVHGLFYDPVSDEFTGVGRPPLVVLVHGGPTSLFDAGWSPQAQFMATRGFAVLAVNYRGSTGYGRAYMQALRRNWGVCDVEDSVSGAQALALAGRIDGERTAIMGQSAGGFTVLQTMIDHPAAFAAGVCLYGVANQFTLVADTHKFEERYSDALLGPLPDAAATYRERSPQFRAAEIRRPLAVFQGEIDEVVPKSQSDAIVAALARNGTPHEYHVYAGEGHGWRKSETIDAFYSSLERFLRQYLVYT